jgi:hypothetical protein
MRQEKNEHAHVIMKSWTKSPVDQGFGSIRSCAKLKNAFGLCTQAEKLRISAREPFGTAAILLFARNSAA